jgi:hypothetical protein
MSKTLLATALFLILGCSRSPQGVIGVVEYIKTNNEDEFLKTEQEWHKVYRELIKKNEIVGCSVYKVLYKTKEEDYNYIKILWFDAFSKINFQFDAENYISAYPQKNEDDWKNFLERTRDVYEVVNSGIFQQQISLTNGLDQVGEFYRINEINIKPGKSKEYRRLIEDIYMPVYREGVKNNNRTVWSLWAKWTGNLDSFEYTTADGYNNMGQIDEDKFAEYFRTVHPNKNMDDVSAEMKDLSVLVNSEMWKLVYRILE